MKEWNRQEAIDIISEIIGDNISEDLISDTDVELLAIKIVDRLESES